MKKMFIAIVATILFTACQIEARTAHKWDEEHYANGEFRVKKHDGLKSSNQAPRETGAPGIENGADNGTSTETGEEPVRIDHKGRIYKQSEFPPPRHPAASQ